MSVGLAVALGLPPGCGAATPSREEEAARLQSKLFSVQSVACLSQATQTTCDPGLAAAFQGPSSRRDVSITDSTEVRSKGSIWCEGGRPHLRFPTPAGEVAGEFGQVVWEAIWRVLEVTDLCASTYGRAITVTRDGHTVACKDPRFDMHELLEMALSEAKRGPPVAIRKTTAPDGDGDGGSGICQIDPQSCASPSHTLCPPFLGDPWNGVTARGREEGESEPHAGPEDGGNPGEAAAPGEPRPSQGEITKALGAVLTGARACLKAGAPMATAVIRFGSDGAVQSVEVRAAGAPASACIERALRRARVSSFSGPSVEARITLRPR